MDRIARAILAISAEDPDSIDQGEFGEAIDALVDIISTLIVAGCRGDNELIESCCYAVTEELFELCVAKKLMQDGKI